MRSSHGASPNGSTQSTGRPALLKVLRFCLATLMLYAAAMFVVGSLALLIIDDGPLWYGPPAPRAHSSSTESTDRATPEPNRDATAGRPHFDPHVRRPVTDNTSETALPRAPRPARDMRGAATAKKPVRSQPGGTTSGVRRPTVPSRGK